jgi:hypothetical protein
MSPIGVTNVAKRRHTTFRRDISHTIPLRKNPAHAMHAKNLRDRHAIEIN